MYFGEFVNSGINSSLNVLKFKFASSPSGPGYLYVEFFITNSTSSIGLFRLSIVISFCSL